MITQLNQRSTSWWLCAMTTSILSACMLTIVVYTAFADEPEQNGENLCFAWETLAEVTDFYQYNGCTYRGESSHEISVTNKKNVAQRVEWHYALDVDKTQYGGNPSGCTDVSGGEVRVPTSGEFTQLVQPFDTFSHSNMLWGTWNVTSNIDNCKYDVNAYTNLKINDPCEKNIDPHDRDIYTVPLCD